MKKVRADLDLLLYIQYNAIAMKELDTIILTRNIIKHNLKKGDLGSIVHIYDDGKTFEVEFITTKGKTMAVLTLNQVNIRPMIRDEILHVRGFASI